LISRTSELSLCWMPVSSSSSTRASILFHAGQQLAGVAGFELQAHAGLPGLARGCEVGRAHLFVGAVDGAQQHAGARQHRHHLALRGELQLVDVAAAGRVFHRHHQAAGAHHQRQRRHAAATG
jgi:hypothetical protein